MNTSDEELYNLAFERAVLSTILFEPVQLEAIEAILSASDFYAPFHQDLFEMYQRLNRANMPIDEEFIKEKMPKAKFNEQLMLEVLSANPISNAFHYVEKIKESAIKRRAFSLSTKIKALTLNEEMNGARLIMEIQRELDKLANQTISHVAEVHDIIDIEAKDTEYVCKKFIPFPKDQVTVLSARGGTGKTFAMLQAAMHFLDEYPLEKAFLWLSEDALGKSKRRAELIASQFLQKDVNTYRGRLFLSDDLTIPIIEELNRTIQVSEQFIKFKRQFEPYSFIVLDPLSSFLAVDENSNTYSRLFMELFLNWCKKRGKTLVFIHHTDKEGEKSRGASAIRDAARALYLANAPKDKNGNLRKDGTVEFTIDKDNNYLPSVIDVDGEGKFIRKIFPKDATRTTRAVLEATDRLSNDPDVKVLLPTI